jgi:hypothetical protein
MIRIALPLVMVLAFSCAAPPAGTGRGDQRTGGSAGGPSGAGGEAVSGASGAAGAGALGGAGASAGVSGANGVGGSASAGDGGHGGMIAGAGGQAGNAAASASGGRSGEAGAAGGISGSGGVAAGGGSSGAAGGGVSGGAAGVAGNGGAAGAAPGCDWTNPAGRIVLFDGSSLDGWRNSSTEGPAHWRLVDGVLEIAPANPSANVETTMAFEDLCLHLEYLTPMYPANVTGQQRGNSGIYFKRSYEMQVLDSYGEQPAIDGCGAVYSVSPPLVVACNMQLVWNTYEIEFKASRWSNSGAKLENAVFVSATLNGQVVQENVELDISSTTAGQPDARGPQPLMLQDHGNPVRFRNIWAKIP